MWYGTYKNLRCGGLVYNFLPSWWHRGYGVTFGRKFVFDADYRCERLAYMRRVITDRYPSIPIGGGGDLSSAASASDPDFGNTIHAAAAGCAVVYPEDNYPWNRHLPPGTQPAKIFGSIADVFPHSDIVSQRRYMANRFGTRPPEGFGIRGVLNDALLIYGDELFAVISDEPKTADDMLQYAWQINDKVLDHNISVGYTGPALLTNCTVDMVSPLFYREWLMKCDIMLCEKIVNAGMSLCFHHCGNIDRFLPLYSALPEPDFVEIGWESDVKLSLRAFPRAAIQYIVSPKFLLYTSRDEVAQTAARILQRAGDEISRLRFSAPDIEYGTPDNNIIALYDVLRAASGG